MSIVSSDHVPCANGASGTLHWIRWHLRRTVVRPAIVAAVLAARLLDFERVRDTAHSIPYPWGHEVDHVPTQCHRGGTNQVLEACFDIICRIALKIRIDAPMAVLWTLLVTARAVEEVQSTDNPGASLVVAR